MGKEDSVRTVFITLLLNLCPGCQTQSQQCKEDQSSREATVKGWHSSCLPTVPGPAPPATGLSTPPGKESFLENSAWYLGARSQASTSSFMTLMTPNPDAQCPP